MKMDPLEELKSLLLIPNGMTQKQAFDARLAALERRSKLPYGSFEWTEMDLIYQTLGAIQHVLWQAELEETERKAAA
jgi:hypothetical protein